MHVAVVVVVLFLIHFPSPEESAKPCDDADTAEDCWKMQNQDDSKPPLLDYLAPCNITRVEDKDDVNNRTLIIDPCMNEENRKFMECVLPYVPELDSTDSNTTEPHNDTGICRCYRWWHFWDQAAYDHVSPYNDSFNYELQSDEWFVWNEKLHECVVKDGMPCATIGSVLVHYRCEPKENEHGETITQRCIKVDPEESFYLVCSFAQKISFNLNTVSFLVIFSYLNS